MKGWILFGLLSLSVVTFALQQQHIKNGSNEEFGEFNDSMIRR